MRAPAIRLVLYVLPCLVSSLLSAKEIPNWTVPPYAGARPAGQLSTMTDTSPGIAFVAMSPCRVFDTRNANGPYGGPRLLANVTRNFDIDSGPCTGIPAGVDAYSMNFGAILPDGIGFVTIWPAGITRPTVSTINTIPGYVLANAAVVPAGTAGAISVFPNTGIHLYGDINGYFTDQYNPGVSLHAVSATVAPAIIGENSFPALISIGILGHATAATDSTAGVWGQTDSVGGSLGAFGVLGVAANTSGRTYGVWGETKSVGIGAAGVFGLDGAGLVAGHNSYDQAGVRGESHNGIGILGITDGNKAVWGIRVNPANGIDAVAGILGFGPYGVYSSGDTHVEGTFTAALNKGFVQPHPFDASKEIRYISLEGPHTEVYFRGTAQVSRGVTRIIVPQDFRFVADAATYSTLVTPVGEMATVAVLTEGPDGIVVRASRDVKIHYVVYAEREAVRNPDPIIENVHFRSDPDRDILAHLPDTFRQLMIQNGTLKPDGTLNMETARRLGWDKEWEKRSKPVAQSPPD
jgi:hypothetical protein